MMNLKVFGYESEASAFFGGRSGRRLRRSRIAGILVVRRHLARSRATRFARAAFALAALRLTFGHRRASPVLRATAAFIAGLGRALHSIGRAFAALRCAADFRRGL